MLEYTNILEAKNIYKKLKNFELNIDELNIPRGFSTALIGENGAGKTTLLNILSGVRLDYKGQIRYFDNYDNTGFSLAPEVYSQIGFTSVSNYYMPFWTINKIDELNKTFFDNYNSDKFFKLCKALAITDNVTNYSKKVSELSEGNKIKLMLAGVLARDTEFLILDEPASALDPLMRDVLCGLIRDYIASKDGRTVFFSTHNISDMENVTDYAIILEHGRIVERGFIDDLKEKYILVKGEACDADKVSQYLLSISKSSYGFEGICPAENLDMLAGLDIVTETPSLFQISVAIMKKNTHVSL